MSELQSQTFHVSDLARLSEEEIASRIAAFLKGIAEQDGIPYDLLLKVFIRSVQGFRRPLLRGVSYEKHEVFYDWLEAQETVSLLDCCAVLGWPLDRAARTRLGRALSELHWTKIRRRQDGSEKVTRYLNPRPVRVP